MPLSVFVAYRFFAQNRTRMRALSLAWGIFWRFFAMFYAIGLVGMIFALPFFFVDRFKLFEKYSNHYLIGFTFGFLGGIIVFIVAYRRGKRERLVARA